MIPEGHEMLYDLYGDNETYYDVDDEGEEEHDASSNSEQEGYWEGKGAKSKGAGRHSSFACTTCDSKWHKTDDCPINKLKGMSDGSNAGGCGHG